MNYVKKILEWYIVSKDRFLIGVKTENEIVGYVGGAKGTGSTSGMLQYAYWQGFASITVRPCLFFNYSFLSHIRLISKIFKKRIFQQRKNIELSATKTPQHKVNLSVGLIVIGVNPKYRRKGIGSILLKAFNDKSRQLGGSYGHLSVKTSNNNAIEAYKKNGWEIVNSNNNSTCMKIKIR